MPKLLLAHLPAAMESAAEQVKAGIELARAHLTAYPPPFIEFSAEIIVDKSVLQRVETRDSGNSLETTVEGTGVSVTVQDPYDTETNSQSLSATENNGFDTSRNASAESSSSVDAGLELSRNSGFEFSVENARSFDTNLGATADASEENGGSVDVGHSGTIESGGEDSISEETGESGSTEAGFQTENGFEFSRGQNGEIANDISITAELGKQISTHIEHSFEVDQTLDDRVFVDADDL